MRLLGLLLLLLPLTCVAQEKTKEASFPDDTEIQLMLTQADRAVQQYQLLIDEEVALLGEKGKEAAEKDRQVAGAIRTGVEALRKNPQGFNSPFGFSFFEWLDDAARNALLCATTSSTQSTSSMMIGQTASANQFIHLAQSCMDMSTLLYTVSENAGALYTRYVESEDQLAKKAFDVAKRCSEALKAIKNPK